MSLFTDRCTNENRSDGRGGTGRPALTTASRWRDDGVTRAVGGGTMPILITAILLFLLALLIIAGPLLEDIIDKIWPPDGRTAQRPR
jgi:hypothetical protein